MRLLSPARYGPLSPSVSSERVLAVASRSRTLRRIAGDRGARQRCSALSQKLARKRRRAGARTPQCCSRDRNILPNKIPARNRVLYLPARQATQLYRCSRIRASSIAHRFREPPQAPNLNSYDPMEEPGIEPAAKSGLRPRRHPSARASARRGKQISPRSCSVLRASVHAIPQDHVSTTLSHRNAAISHTSVHETPQQFIKNAGHGQLPHARPADELQDAPHDATPRQAP